jgi:branched-chain amino acid transport system permease protein
VSLGSAAFMAVGAFASYNFVLRIPGIPLLVAFVLGGLCAAAVGIVFGLPSLRIRGFYLAASTLATQFFVVWCLTKIPWLTNYSSSGVITAQKMEMFGTVRHAESKYLLVLVDRAGAGARGEEHGPLQHRTLVDGDPRHGRRRRGHRLPADAAPSLTAFAISSFYCGVAGALYAYAYLGTVEPEAYNLDLSFRILFMVMIGGLGSILGSFLGAAFIILLPIFLSQFAHCSACRTASPSNLEAMVFGALIIFFLIVEPHGSRGCGRSARKSCAVAVSALTREKSGAPHVFRGFWRNFAQFSTTPGYRPGRGQRRRLQMSSSITKWLTGVAVGIAVASSALAQDQYVPILSYRVGPLRRRAAPDSSAARSTTST